MSVETVARRSLLPDYSSAPSGPTSYLVDWQRESRSGDLPTLADLGFLTPHEAQARILTEAKRFNVANCGRRTGKTELGKRKAAEAALDRSPVVWFSPTYKMLMQVWRELAELLRPVTSRLVASEHRIELVTGGSIDFFSMDMGGADRVRGRKYGRAILDECAMVAGLLDAWEKAIRPTLADLRGDAWFLSTPRRGSGFEDLYRRADADAEWASWTVPTSANPFILREEIEAMRLGMSDQTYAQEILADFAASESELVFPEDLALIFVPKRVEWADCAVRIAAIDPGGGDPTAIVPLGLDAQGHIHQYGEFYRRGDVSLEHVAEYLTGLDRKGPLKAVVVGETGGNVLTNTLRSMGFPAAKADLGDGSKNDGIDLVRMLYQRGRLTIQPECHNSRAEFAGYRWAFRKDPATGERYMTKTPHDHHADAHDARRYGCVFLLKRLGSGKRDVRVVYA